VTPVGLSPHLGSGALVDSWNEWPPRHTPGNPPYLPELLGRRLRPLQDARLYRVAVPPEPPLVPPGRAAVRSFDPARLAADLLPLLVAATENPVAGFPPPDAAEAAFILRRLGLISPAAYLAEVDYTPVGFVLAQRDTLPDRRRWALGRRWAAGRRLALSAARAGRVIFGAVLPDWRGQGIGRQLWQRTLRDARERGWETLTLGPIWQPREGPSPVAELLGPAAEARQTYRLYERSF
jgi:GNAT superfamily N-acetyltransferase